MSKVKTATYALEIAAIAMVAKRLVILGRPRNKAIGDVAAAYMLTRAQVKLINSLV